MEVKETAQQDILIPITVAEIFSQMNRMGYIARDLFEEACQRAIQKREDYKDDMTCLYEAVLSLGEGRKTLLAKYRTLFTRVRFHKEFDLWREGKVTVLDLSGYSIPTQIFLIQLVMSVLWRYYRIFGRQMETETILALDEFQNLPLKDNSILTQILREGRKFHLSLLLATQTIFTFDTAKRVILQQPATKLYFRPAEEEVKRIAKYFSDFEAVNAEEMLRDLQVGECLARGEFEISGRSGLRTLKVRFREEIR